MRNLIIAIVVAIIGWVMYTQIKDQKKPEESTIVKYAVGLKSDKDKAAEAKDTANLAIVRSAITQFHGSQGKYPENLQELVSKGYLDRLPDGISYDKETGEVNF